MTDEALAQLFHGTYERLAPMFGYNTRPESAVPWADLPTNHKQLMIRVCYEVKQSVNYYEPPKDWQSALKNLLESLTKLANIGIQVIEKEKNLDLKHD